METVNTTTIETKATIKTTLGIVSFPEYVGSANGRVSAKLWEKEGKCRIYFSVYFSGSKTDCGFYDVVAKKSYLVSNPKAIARQIESEIEVL